MRKFIVAASVAALGLFGAVGFAGAQDPPVTSIDNSVDNSDQNNNNHCRDATIIADLIQTVSQSQNQHVEVPTSTGDVNQTQGDQAVQNAIEILIDCSVTNNVTNPPGETTVVTLPTGQTVVLPVVLQASAPVAVSAVPRFTG